MTERRAHADLIIAWAEGATIQYFNGGEWHDMDSPAWHEGSRYRVKHKHQECIDAYYEGKQIQVFSTKRGWVDVPDDPLWDCELYRIKPEPKEDIRARLWTHGMDKNFHIVFVFDGETKEFKTVEYHDD